MTDIGRILWQGCHTLRHEGVAYDEYVDQLSLLLFVKMAAESGTRLPTGATWKDLQQTPDELLLDHYVNALKTLSSEPGIVGDTFSGSRSRFRTAKGLREVLRLLDNTNWSSLDQDVQGAAFEYLLERTASEGKQGAGQYFTPRPLVRTIVGCLQPGSKSTDKVVGDPAAGTAGFLVEAHRWVSHSAPERALDLRFIGNEIVSRARRLGLMNLHVHGVRHPEILLADALASSEAENTCDVIITNPPFGSRSGARPDRENFWISTGNKQINFVQHVALSLRRNGRAALVLPDNCFGGDQPTVRLWEEIYANNQVHTILRLPKGTFAPYASGIMTNVVFVNAGRQTKHTWIYDARTSVRIPTGRKPLQETELAEFRTCYGRKADGSSVRTPSQSPTGRWQRYKVADMREHLFRLDRLIPPGNLKQRPHVDQLIQSAEDDLTAALEGIRQLKRLTVA